MQRWWHSRKRKGREDRTQKLERVEEEKKKGKRKTKDNKK